VIERSRVRFPTVPFSLKQYSAFNPSGVGKSSTDLLAGVKAGCVHLCHMAGNTCHLQRRCQPCDARSSCPPRPWCALLGSLYTIKTLVTRKWSTIKSNLNLSNKCISYLDISVFGVPSLSCHPPSLLPPDFRDHAVSWHVLWSSVAVGEQSSLTHAAHMLLSSLPHYLLVIDVEIVRLFSRVAAFRCRHVAYAFDGFRVIYAFVSRATAWSTSEIRNVDEHVDTAARSRQFVINRAKWSDLLCSDTSPTLGARRTGGNRRGSVSRRVGRRA